MLFEASHFQRLVEQSQALAPSLIIPGKNLRCQPFKALEPYSEYRHMLRKRTGLSTPGSAVTCLKFASWFIVFGLATRKDEFFSRLSTPATRVAAEPKLVESGKPRPQPPLRMRA